MEKHYIIIFTIISINDMRLVINWISITAYHVDEEMLHQECFLLIKKTSLK